VSPRPVTTVFAIPALDHGGPDKVFFDILRHLDREAVAPHVVVAEPDGFYLSHLPTAIPVERLATSKIRLIHRYPVVALARFVRSTRPHVAVTTLRMNDTALMARRLSLWPRSTRLIIRPANEIAAPFADLRRERRSLRHRIAEHAQSRNLRYADAVICQSEQIRSEVAQLGLRERSTVIGNGVDTAWLDEQATRDPMTAKGSPALIAVGRLSWQKGFDLLLRALKNLQERYPTLHLTIAGDGPERERLEALAAELGIREAVTLLGHLDNPFGLIRSGDLLVCSSRYEGFANVVLEALGLGTPVVAVRGQGAADEVVHNGVNGFLAASADPADLRQALAEAFDHHEGFSRRSIIDDTRARFDIDAIARRYAAVIEATARAPERD
jgi:glycosyltransferase involved in cell wall biosynthesis